VTRQSKITSTFTSYPDPTEKEKKEIKNEVSSEGARNEQNRYNKFGN